ncbi:MAG: hypothetical protein LC632_02500 [Xanthomonadaceae bacterium]|nr:hypothetical protein [Xanthomonadaceae bacterium]
MSKKSAVAAVVAALMLAGCSTAPIRVSDAPMRVIDHAKVAAVDEVAQVRGIRVVWVNHPMVREGEENKR